MTPSRDPTCRLRPGAIPEYRDDQLVDAKSALFGFDAKCLADGLGNIELDGYEFFLFGRAHHIGGGTARFASQIIDWLKFGGGWMQIRIGCLSQRRSLIGNT